MCPRLLWVEEPFSVHPAVAALVVEAAVAIAALGALGVEWVVGIAVLVAEAAVAIVALGAVVEAVVGIAVLRAVVVAAVFRVVALAAGRASLARWYFRCCPRSS